MHLKRKKFKNKVLKNILKDKQRETKLFLPTKRLKFKSIEAKFIGCLTKKGKKNKFRTIFYRSLFLVSKKFKMKSLTALQKMVRTLSSIIEIRKLKTGRNTSIVPIPVGAKRRNYLVIKKILTAINKDKSKISLTEKLQKEFTLILKRRKNAISIMEKQKVLKEALENRSNTHFRW